jgi:hypothetical protein
MAGEKDLEYGDENLTERERQSGHTSLPQPEEEGRGEGKSEKDPMSPDRLNPDRPDEFGDGDRRS